MKPIANESRRRVTSYKVSGDARIDLWKIKFIENRYFSPYFLYHRRVRHDRGDLVTLNYLQIKEDKK